MNASASPKHLGVAIFRAARRHAQLSLEVEYPPGNPLCVFTDQFFCSLGNFQAVKIMPSLVAIIQADVDHIRIALRNLVYQYAHTLQARQIARGRRIRAGGWFGGRIYGIHIEVLIAVVILSVKAYLLSRVQKYPATGRLVSVVRRRAALKGSSTAFT